MSGPDEIASAFAFAAGLWPGSVEPGSEAVRLAWTPALAGWDHRELCEGFLALSQESPRFPTLAGLLALLRERRLAAAQRETRPRLGSGSVGDMWALRGRVRPDIAGEIRAHAGDGPFSARLAEVMCGDDPRPTERWMAETFTGGIRPGPQRLGDIIGRPTLESRARELADAFLAGEHVSPEDYAEDERAEARRLIREAREATA